MKFKIAKIKSFTVIELMVVLIITSIVIFAAITGFLKVQQLYFNSKQIGEESGEIASLYAVLNYDFEQCQKAESWYNELTLYFTDYTVMYEFDDDKITRSQLSNTEEYNFGVKTLQFDGLDGRNKYIYEIIADIDYRGLNFPFILHKEYPAKIKYQIDNK